MIRDPLTAARFLTHFADLGQRPEEVREETRSAPQKARMTIPDTPHIMVIPPFTCRVWPVT